MNPEKILQELGQAIEQFKLALQLKAENDRAIASKCECHCR